MCSGRQTSFPMPPNRRYTPDDAPKEMLAALHAHLGIERAVIVQASCHGTDNAAMLDCIASDPKRYRGVAIVDDSFTDKDYDSAACGGVRGVRFNFVEASRWRARHGRVRPRHRPHRRRAAGTSCCTSTRPISSRSRT